MYNIGVAFEDAGVSGVMQTHPASFDSRGRLFILLNGEKDMGFMVEVTLATGQKVAYEYDTAGEAETFVAGVNAALSWPRRTHKGLLIKEFNPPVEVKQAPPVVVEKKAVALNEGLVDKGGLNPPNSGEKRPEPPQGSGEK